MSESASSISPIATIQSYDDLLAACRRQVQALGINLKAPRSSELSGGKVLQRLGNT
jgi:hypothetical protein